MMRIALVGATGRLGKEVAEQAVLAGHTLVRWDPRVDRTLPPVDVMINVAAPAAFDAATALAERAKLPLVVGTTGLAEDAHARLQELSLSVPVLYTPNFSLGITALGMALRAMRCLKEEGFEISVHEVHRIGKKDAPSGTAKELTAAAGGAAAQSFLRVHEVFGEHEVTLYGDGEVLRLRHEARSRTMFAKGALRAAMFLITQPPGLYSMEDCLQSVQVTAH